MKWLFRSLSLAIFALIATLIIASCAEEEKPPAVIVPVGTVTAVTPPEGSEIPANQEINITFDNSVKNVTVNGTPATGSEKSWKWKGDLTGQTGINIAWTNEDGSAGEGRTIVYKIRPLDSDISWLDTEVKLDDASRRELLQIARLSIEEFLKSGNIPKLKPQNSELLKKSGAFVVLEKAGNLRGCIGYTQPIMSLCETVTRAAIAAATQDTRFMPVSKEELKQIEIEISVLSPLRRVEDINEIEVGKHGLFIRKEGRSGLLLSQVAIEEGWGRIAFLQHACLKAGLPLDTWKDKETEIYVFTADTFSEKEFSLP